MKKSYTILALATCLFSTGIQAQSQDSFKYLDINNLKVPLFSRGNMFREVVGEIPKAEIPKGEFTTVLKNQNLWFGGQDQNKELRIAGQRFYGSHQRGLDLFIGPISKASPADINERYNKVWKISKEEIEYHKTHFHLPTYQMPEDILNWPAHGETNQGEAANLAPFTDVNQNGVYEPTLGDYPNIRGDQALFAMFNDAKKSHSETLGQITYTEVHVMLYAYENPYSDFVDNSFFVHYELYNRSEDLTYSDFYITQFLDYELGLYLDDYVGTHIGKNIAYVYNSDNNDEYDIGYGENPPAFGWTLLNQDYTSTMFRPSSIPVIGIPWTPNEIYYGMQGLYNDGSSMKYRGYHNSGNQPTKFVFPGTSNPMFEEEWYHFTTDNPQIYTTMLATTKVENFGSGDKICLDYAGVFSRDNTSDQMHQLNQLFADVDGVKSIYDYENFNCSSQVLSLDETTLNTPKISQVDQTLAITQAETGLSQRPIQIVNALGQTLLSVSINPSENEQVIDISHLPSGVYFIPHQEFKFVVK